MIHSCYFSLVTPFPRTATVFGDPHVYTFDNIPYTFNGMGEHFMFLFLGVNFFAFVFVSLLSFRMTDCVSCLIR